jgi:asparagine synthase (glutamine-hydrolysing)
MCGLAGEIRFKGFGADVESVRRMGERMSDRGPDSWGVWGAGPVALAHQRLQIIDLSSAGGQPMVDSDLRLTLVFNGCVYNYKELRQRLEAAGYRFFSTSDSEVVLKAYHCWGVECVQHFFGMFAFAVVVWDTGEVVLGRDRLGIKPLYVSADADRLRFASTLPALVAGGDVDTSLDPVALHHYLTFHSVVPPPRTILRGVQKLPPATVRVVSPDGTWEDTTYWEPSFARPAPGEGMSVPEWQDGLMERLRVAVERRRVADVPVGVLLSGGIDSSIVVALLAEAGQHDLKTFSIGFDDAGGESGNEFFYSDIVAKRFGTDHHQIHIDGSRMVPAVSGAVRAMSEPMVSHDCVAFYLLSQEVARYVKVVQSGQGADEILAGYDWYPPLADVPLEEAPEAYAGVFFDRRHEALLELVEPGLFEGDASGDFVRAHFARPGAATAVDAALRLDTTVMLVDDPVKRVDNMTMAWGLEARVPFLDHEFVEFAAAAPPGLKLSQGGKGILKEASRPHLPAEVIDREKGYFPVPGIRHLSGELLDQLQAALTDPGARTGSVFRHTAVQDLLAAPNEVRTTLGANALWQVALLELWLREHVG